MAQKHSPSLLQVCAPPALRVAVKAAADREMMTISEFVRRTLIDRLRADGVNPATPIPATNPPVERPGFDATGAHA